MPLPLPDLDTRRWADLVEEGRGLIPRYAPGWTDHNIHDPGITLMELFAWLVESDIYRANRVPERHRRKFLDLIGFAPRPSQGARVALALTLRPGASVPKLPAGVIFQAAAGGQVLPFRTLADLEPVEAALAAVQSFAGGKFADLTRARRDDRPFAPWGLDLQEVEAVPAGAALPEAQPAFYLGLMLATPPPPTFSFWFGFAGDAAQEAERGRIVAEAEAWERERACPPPNGSCGPDSAMSAADPAAATAAHVPVLPAHHGVTTAWDYFDGTRWHSLDPGLGEVIDDTRSFTLSGRVLINLPGEIKAVMVGAVPAELFYLRCRLTGGRPDYAPELEEVSVNAVPAEQIAAASATLPIRKGANGPAAGELPAGQTARLKLTLDRDFTIAGLAKDGGDGSPEILVLGYVPATERKAGSLSLDLVPLGSMRGLPGESVVLPGGLAAGAAARVWTVSAGAAQSWTIRGDLDAARRTDRAVTLDAATGRLAFGDGEKGRVVPDSSVALAAYDITAGSAGNIPARAEWRLAGVDDSRNSVLVGAAPARVEKALAGIVNVRPAYGGAVAEDVDSAAGRAAAALWAHERLLDICPPDRFTSLDEIGRDQALSVPAPQRATTLLDFERLALGVPGAPVARARAWSGIDPVYPGLAAPGTVAVVVVPWLPQAAPEPGSGLLEAIRRYLELRRTVGTRLVIAGPRYLTVGVRATVAIRPGARADRVCLVVAAKLDAFLHPLTGGPHGRGWPFGRDIYRSEILAIVDGADGVDHVESLELVPGAGGSGSGEPQCGNLCLDPTWLVKAGPHDIRPGSGGPNART